MATNPPKKSNMRRPAKKRSPLSPANKLLGSENIITEKNISTAKQVTKSKVATSKTLQKKKSKVIVKPKVKTKPSSAKAAKKPTKTKTIKKPSSKTVSQRKQRAVTPAIKQVKLLSFPLGHKTKLVISINRSKPKTGKSPAKSNKQLKTKKHELVLTSILLLAGMFGTVFFGLQAFASPPAPPAINVSANQKVANTEPVEKVLPRSEPLRLRIPDIQLDTSLITVGKKADGTLEVPVQSDKAGWYRLSPTPGEIGPSIIVGHLDSLHGIAIFWRLSELVPGQIINVDRQDGSSAEFLIQKVQQFPQDNFPTNDVYGNINFAGLRLITCGGTFNKLTGHYDANTVVFASLLSRPSIQNIDKKS